MNKISGQEERREEKRREEKKKKRQKREEERDQPEEIPRQEEKDTPPAWFMEYMENYKDEVATEIITKIVHSLGINIENKLVINVQPL